MDGPTRVGAGGQRDRTARGRKVEISAALSGRQSTGEVPEKASPVRVLDSASADARKPRCLFCSQRSEEHTSELQSRSDLVCRLLLEKKKIASVCFCLISIDHSVDIGTQLPSLLT